MKFHEIPKNHGPCRIALNDENFGKDFLKEILIFLGNSATFGLFPKIWIVSENLGCFRKFGVK